MDVPTSSGSSEVGLEESFSHSDDDSIKSWESMSVSDEWDEINSQQRRSLKWQVIGDFPIPGEYPTWTEYRAEFLKWLGPLTLIKDDILASIGVTLTLVPEAIAFAIIAKVPPISGLYATFFMCLLCGIFGGRPGMISGATGAVAVVQGQLVTVGIFFFFPPPFFD